MKITLILAAGANDPLKKTDPFMPLSLPLLAGAAPEHEYTFVDMLAEEMPDYDKPTDIVGISSRITAESTAYKIADEFRKRNVPVVLGGAQISSVPHRAKAHADVVVVGEGEPLWPILLNDFETKKLKDFYVCSPVPFDAKGMSVYQMFSYFDLKNVPTPLRYLYRKKYDFDTVFASRGCPINCDFCSVSSIFGCQTRLRPIADVVKEIDTFKNFYYLLDDTVFGRPSNYDYYTELFDTIIKLPKKRFWTGQANLDAASTPEGREIIRKAAQAGLLYASIGIESINPEVMKTAGTLKKNGVRTYDMAIQEMQENIRFIQEQGIVISGWFTIGYDQDTIQTFYDTLKFCEENNLIHIINALEALPGTQLFDRLTEENRIDTKKTINVSHPVLRDEEVLIALKNVNKKGFTFRQNLKRTMYYAKYFDRDTRKMNDKIHNKIFKFIFTFVLQNKLKKGVIGYINSSNS